MDVGRTHEILPAWWPSGWFPSAIHSCWPHNPGRQNVVQARARTCTPQLAAGHEVATLVQARARTCTPHLAADHEVATHAPGSQAPWHSCAPDAPRCGMHPCIVIMGQVSRAHRGDRTNQNGAAGRHHWRCGRRRRCRRCGVAHPALVDNTTVRFWVVARLSAGVHRNAARANRAHSLSVSSRCGCCLTYSGA